MKLKYLKYTVAAGLMAVGAVPQMAQATSAACTAPCTTAGIAVTYNITIPSFLRFQLGTVAGAPSAAWTLTTANVGDGTAQSPTVTNSGTATAGSLRYRLRGNNGTGLITVAATGAPVAGPTSGLNVIPWADITATTTVVSGPSLAYPAPAGNSTVTPATAVFDIEGDWNLSYANTTVYPAGAPYSGTVTYTAQQP